MSPERDDRQFSKVHNAYGWHNLVESQTGQCQPIHKPPSITTRLLLFKPFIFFFSHNSQLIDRHEGFAASASVSYDSRATCCRGETRMRRWNRCPVCSVFWERTGVASDE